MKVIKPDSDFYHPTDSDYPTAVLAMHVDTKDELEIDELFTLEVMPFKVDTIWVINKKLKKKWVNFYKGKGVWKCITDVD